MAGIVNGTATTNGGLAWTLGPTEYSVGISGSNLAAVTSVDGADSVLALVSNVPKSITIDELFASVPIGTHNHDDRYYTESEVDTLLTGYSATGHTHDDRYYTEAEITTLLANYSVTTHNHDATYAALVHTHDDRYYTESEVDALLTGYTATGHTHVAADVTNFQTSVSLNTNVTANTAARHTQGTDAGLDTGGANACTAAEIRALLDAAWAGGDHGVLSGLSDDDHTQYVLANGTRAITGAQTVTGSLAVDSLTLDESSVYANTGSSAYFGFDASNRLDVRSNAAYMYLGGGYTTRWSTAAFFPNTDQGLSLGGASFRWNAAYIDNILINGNTIYGTGDLLLSGDSDVYTDRKFGVGIAAPENPLEVLDANSTDSTPPVQIRQTGTFDASVRLRVPATSWTFGIDNSDSDIFKIENATVLGGASPAFTLDTSGNLTALGGGTFGGGYGSTGVTISSAGAISMDGALTVAGTNPVATWDAPSVLPWNWQVVNATGDFRVLYSGSVPLLFDTSLNVKLSGGYGSSGVTVDASGNTSMNGNLITDGTLSVAGGYGSSGFSVDASGNVSADGDILTDGYIRHNTTQAHNYRKTEAVYGDVNNGASADTVTIAPPAGTGLVAAIGIVRLDILAANADSEFSYYLSGTYSCKIDSGGDTVAAVGTPVESDPNNIATVSISEAGNGFLIEISETVSSGVLGYVVSYSVTWCMQ